jgi:hypothetical protein
LYWPQAKHTLWGRLYSPQLGHFTKVGAANFQTLERLLFFLVLEILLAGTAMSAPPYPNNQ